FTPANLKIILEADIPNPDDLQTISDFKEPEPCEFWKVIDESSDGTTTKVHKLLGRGVLILYDNGNTPALFMLDEVELQERHKTEKKSMSVTLAPISNGNGHQSRVHTEEEA